MHSACGNSRSSPTALVDVTFPTENNPTNLKMLMKADKPGAVAKVKELEKHEQREYACVAEKSGFQFYAAAMEKQSLTQGQGHKEMLRRVAAHRHGEDFDADVDNEHSCKKGVWCARTAWACWRQALMVEFVNNREETIAKGVAKAISRCGDGVLDVCVKCPS